MLMWWKAAEAAFLRVSLRKLFLYSCSILTKVALATLLRKLSIVVNFVDISQDFFKKRFAVQEKLLRGCFSSLQVIYTCPWRCRSKLSITLGWSRVNVGVHHQNLLPFVVLLVCPRGTRANGDTSLRIGSIFKAVEHPMSSLSPPEFPPSLISVTWHLLIISS